MNKVEWNFTIEEDHPDCEKCKMILLWLEFSKSPIILTHGGGDKYNKNWLDSNGQRVENFSYWSYIFSPEI